jgi:serine phosphatase RsbU (regulator of sigma subunit)
MASLRFATRAYAAERYTPALTLAKLGEFLEASEPAPFATVLCGILDLERRSLTLASAGHPGPLLRDCDGTRFVEVKPGPPIGLPTQHGYEQTSFPIEDEGLLLAFTDGLFEKRGEAIDIGLDKLRVLAERDSESLTDLLRTIVRDAVAADHDDDLAILGLQWRAPNGRLN